MQGNDNNQPPTKRRRLALPDGFTEIKSPVKIATPKFVSGFNDKPSSNKWPTTLECSKPAMRSLRQEQPNQLDSLTKSTRLMVRKPPVLSPALKPSVEAGPAKEVASIAAPRFLFPAPSDSSRNNIFSIESKFLQPPQSPKSKSAAPLKPLAPPSFPVAGPSRGAARSMKSIFATNVALATDLRSENGPAEVLSIQLQAHGHSFMDPTERELQRGLQRSPERLSKHKKSSEYTSGGLAERASMLFSQQSTALSLWQTALQRDIRSRRRVKPDMRLRIVAILHVANSDDHQRSSHAPCLGLVRCRSLPESQTPDVVVLLNFDGAASSTVFNKLSDLRDGRELHIWRPWHTISGSHSAHTAMSTLLSDSEPTGDVRYLDESSNVLLCTRFWIVPTS